MIHKIFTVYDVAAEAYLPPFMLHQQGMAIREFQNMCNDQQHRFGANPEDYILFELGTFDDETAEYETHEPLSVANGIEMLRISTREEIINQMRQHAANEENFNG